MLYYRPLMRILSRFGIKWPSIMAILAKAGREILAEQHHSLFQRFHLQLKRDNTILVPRKQILLGSKCQNKLDNSRNYCLQWGTHFSLKSSRPNKRKSTRF